MIARWKRIRPSYRWVIGLSCALLFAGLFFWGLSGLLGVRRVVIWSCVIVWFLHVFIGAGAGFAAWRLWPDRENAFIRRVVIALHAQMVATISAIVLLFMSSGVVFTRKFAVTLFLSTLIMDAAVLPLILYIVRGPQRDKTEIPNRSGEMPPEFWKKEFRNAVRSEIKDEYLKDE